MKLFPSPCESYRDWRIEASDEYKSNPSNARTAARRPLISQVTRSLLVHFTTVAAMAPRAPEITDLLPITHHRLYLEPIGPPTELVQPKEFVAEAQKALDKAKERVKELEQRLSQSGVEEQVRKKCR